ncbi:acyl-CoA dehydrogenase [Paenibacillus flagellatus]|uniref:Acyl-CoA dehydrogenase n=1 Tax=Paenibacillus flagellatus TaxID=2211139 RepID=A0A2V5K437_9BACL|nr:acyl-CoA dehydrogenase [Paenibacillus flagellatus]
MDRLFVRTPEQLERLGRIGELADSFAEGARLADEEDRFAYDHVEALRRIGYPAYTVPRERGGEGATLYEFVLYQERLAQGDAAIALGMGWHLGVLFDLDEKRPWREETFAALCRDVVERGALVNRAATEAATGSPARGGKPRTTAEPLPGGGYRLNGRKTYTTMAPVLDYFIVTAALEDGEGEFLVRRGTEGVSIDETWDMVGMRGTASHDLVLRDVVVPGEALVYAAGKAYHQTPNPYLLHIPACYLGIALAARKEALRFAKSYQPNSLPHPILHTPNVGQHFGQIELQLSAARRFLYAVAARWDELRGRPEAAGLIPELAAVKLFAMETALSVVDKAMRIVGSHGLARSHPLQRLYRDVRFGLHNPPMEDAAVAQLGRQAVQDAERL